MTNKPFKGIIDNVTVQKQLPNGTWSEPLLPNNDLSDWVYDVPTWKHRYTVGNREVCIEVMSAIPITFEESGIVQLVSISSLINWGSGITPLAVDGDVPYTIVSLSVKIVDNEVEE